MKQLRLNWTKYSQMALLHTPNSKKEDWRIKTINSSTFLATKRILDLKKETASSKQRRVKRKSKPGSEWRLWDGCKRLCLERKGMNRKRPMQALSLLLSLTQKSLSMPMLSNNDNYIKIYLFMGLLEMDWLLCLWVYFLGWFMVWFGFLFLVFLDLMEIKLSQRPNSAK